MPDEAKPEPAYTMREWNRMGYQVLQAERAARYELLHGAALFTRDQVKEQEPRLVYREENYDYLFR